MKSTAIIAVIAIAAPIVLAYLDSNCFALLS